MAVILEAIKLNHDPQSATTSALNIRKNATDFFSVTGWLAGISTTPEDSRAAYAIKATTGQTVTIQAAFRWLGPDPKGPVEIRALDPTVNPPGAPGCAIPR